MKRPVPEGIVLEGQYGTTEFQQQGMLFHSFDFWWDHADTPTVTHGARTIPAGVTSNLIWAMFELADRFYTAVGFSGLIEAEFRLEGVKNAFFMHEALYTRPYDPTPIIDEVIPIRRTYPQAEIAHRKAAIAREYQKEIYWSCGINASDNLVDQDFQPRR
jgi:hypothetical protein